MAARRSKRKARGGRVSPDPNFKRWVKYAAEGQYWKPKVGVHVFEVTAEPVYTEKQFGDRTNKGVEIPTDHGTLSTGNKGFLAALAEADEQRSIVGRIVRMRVFYDGSEKDDKNRRLEVLSVK
jgi:hypothetical protein